jgi:hypothetical protein
MSKALGVFGFDVGPKGVSIYSTTDYVTNAAMTDAELDRQIMVVKLDLDATAKRAKAALRKYLPKS